TVNDVTPPTITTCAPDQSANAANGTSCSAAVPDFTATTVASDTCSSVTNTQSPVAGTLVGVGPHPITITATDASSNSSTCNATFTVNDTTATWYRDADADGLGDPNNTLQSCPTPARHVLDSTDCDDTRASVHP